MKVLLDTHTFLWWVADDPQISVTAKNIIANPDNDIYLSVVSAWEIMIKVGTGKLSLIDRLLIAQSLVEDFPLVTVDSAIAQYSVQTIW
ncbi:MAG: type II toxin-antitoxin system VapC family toxin [Pseudanabaena sp. CAN_BIN31]|nr:type II toxin-antitoxin system VapC family toxin [Pseudanabaena sp. CAN_BIN31]